MPLYIIPTPIGNRFDITLHALQTLFSVDILLCEDTRKTGQLIQLYRQQFTSLLQNELQTAPQSRPQLLSFYEGNEDARLPYILEQFRQNKHIGLVSNAGTPGISDPGFKLVLQCVQEQIPIIPLPGPSALTTALSASGLSADKFTFLGFLPKKSGKQAQIWNSLKESNLKQTIIFYESPYRIKKTLETLLSVYDDIEVCIARELTKIHESITTNLISTWLTTFATPPKGELVILFRSGQS